MPKDNHQPRGEMDHTRLTALFSTGQQHLNLALFAIRQLVAVVRQDHSPKVFKTGIVNHLLALCNSSMGNDRNNILPHRVLHFMVEWGLH